MVKIYPDLEGLRAIDSVRVSLTKQSSMNETTGAKDDIPVQREICEEFINANKMKHIGEVIESGVSASKVPLAKRRKMLELIERAKRREFDVLVVFKHDRLSRIQEEYPLILKLFNENGVRIFIATSSEEKRTTHLKGANASAEEGVMNSLDGYTAAQESQNMKERVTCGQRVAIRNGQYRGGGYPFGYELANLGHKNLKGGYINTQIIIPEKAEVVKKAFGLASEGYSIRGIVRVLNTGESRTLCDNGEAWGYNSVRNMLHNVTYCGYYHFKINDDSNRTFYSERLDNLAIISKDLFDEVQKKIAGNAKNSDKRNDRTITQGHGLCAGFIYCGNCGASMSPWSKNTPYKKKDGTTVQYVAYRYRCSKRTMGRESECNGQSTYGIVKIDSAVEKQVIPFVTGLSKKEFTTEFFDGYDKQIIGFKAERKEKETELAQRHKALDGLKTEFAFFFSGNSIWNPIDLKEALELQKSEIESCKAEISNLLEVEKVTEEEKNKMVSININARTWVDKYQKASIDEKKQLMYEIVERVEVSTPKKSAVYVPDADDKVKVSIFYKAEAMALNKLGCDINSVESCSICSQYFI